MSRTWNFEDPPEPEDPIDELRRSPEGLCWLHVIADAVETYAHRGQRRSLGQPKNPARSFRSAERFLFREESALTVIAPLLGLEVEEIRRSALRKAEHRRSA